MSKTSVELLVLSLDDPSRQKGHADQQREENVFLILLNPVHQIRKKKRTVFYINSLWGEQDIAT